MKTAAVIGPRSMLGAELIRQLEAAGTHVLKVGRSSEDEIYFDLGDGLDPETGGRSADVVFHCAASFEDDSDGGSLRNLRVNADSSDQVSNLVIALGAKTLVYSGSVFSQDGADSAGLGSYGFSKGIAEQRFSHSRSEGLFRFCSVRFSQICDTEGRCCIHQPWFGRIVAYASRGFDIPMPGSDGVRNFIHVSDAVSALIQASTGELSGVLNYTSPESLTMNQIAEEAIKVFGDKGNVKIIPEKTRFRSMVFPQTSPVLSQPKIHIRECLEIIREVGTSDRFGPMDLS